MRTTIDIPDPLFRAAKQRAADEGVSLREVVLRALQLQLGGTRRSGFRFRWRTEKGRLLPGVNLTDRQSLYDILDGRA